MKIGDTEVLPLPEAARRYGIDRTTLFRQAQKGVLKAELVGKTWLVTTQAMDDYMRDHAAAEGRRGRPRKPKGDARGMG
jgi:excisionase family DNA binding protein